MFGATERSPYGVALIPRISVNNVIFNMRLLAHRKAVKMLQVRTYPAGDPSLQVTDTLFKKCSFMSWSSFCAEHGYSDCAKFLICAMKLSMLLSTAVKSNGKLSGPSTSSLYA